MTLFPKRPAGSPAGHRPEGAGPLWPVGDPTFYESEPPILRGEPWCHCSQAREACRKARLIRLQTTGRPPVLRTSYVTAIREERELSRFLRKLSNPEGIDL